MDLLAASIGAPYTVFPRSGIAHGMDSSDMTFLRFGVAGVVTLPMPGRALRRDAGGFIARWRSWLLVAVLAGPLFGLLMLTALQWAPATHAALFPFTTMMKEPNMSTLKQQLTDYQAGFKQSVPAERVATMETATANLRATGIESTALRVGAELPALTLPDATGNPVGLKALNAAGPLVIVFYRGGWCPYCNLELREWQRLLPQLRTLGVTLVAISPQTPDNSLSTSEKNELSFPVLSDSSLAAAQAFGVAFTLSPELVRLYAHVGNDLPTLNGNGQWVLPVPATYVIDRQGIVTFAHVEADYRQRAEPAEVLARLRGVPNPE